MLGENGTGKTTFIRMLAGRLTPDGGGELPVLNVSYKPQKISPKSSVSVYGIFSLGLVLQTHIFFDAESLSQPRHYIQYLASPISSYIFWIQVLCTSYFTRINDDVCIYRVLVTSYT